MSANVLISLMACMLYSRLLWSENFGQITLDSHIEECPVFRKVGRMNIKMFFPLKVKAIIIVA
jgi:hypothetical protein